MSLYEKVLSDLKGVIGSNKDGIPLSKLNNEYEFITGSSLPIKTLGFESILSFIRSVPKQFRIQHCSGILRVFNVVSQDDSESNLALYQMIQNTTNKKSSGKFKNKGYNLGRVPKFPTGFESTSNFSFSNGNSNSYNKGFDFKNFENFQVHISQVPLNSNTNNLYSERFVPNQLVNRDLYAISDNEDNTDTPKSVSVEIQTEEIQYKRMPELHTSLNSVEFVTIIVEIIVEFKPLNLDNVVFFKIATDLYYYFNLLTGINVDPCLFKDIVYSVLSSVKNMELYEDLIYCDDTKKYCCLNLSNTNYSLFHMPHLEFHMSNSFSVEIVGENADSILSVKFSDDSADHLRWGKSRPLSDNAKLVIENQQFWSWIPGSMCLVQLPYTLVQSLSVTPIERAIILATEFASTSDARAQKSTLKLVHRTTFYLIDHKITISGILSCTSSFQTVKRTAYRNNDSELAYVSNVSIRSRCMPAKVQYLRIRNLSDVTQVFHDSRSAFVPGQSLVVYQLQRSALTFNFQPVYDCYARINKDQLEPQRELHCYENGVPKDAPIRHSRQMKMRPAKNEVEVIVISDSDDDDVRIIEPDSDMSLCSMAEPTESVETKPITIVVNGIKEEVDKVSVISFTDDEEADHHRNISNTDSNTDSTSRITTPVSLTTRPGSVGPCKCVIPISGPDIRAQFLGRVIRIMHLQSGTAVLGLLDSQALMKRELLMRSLGGRRLTGLVDPVHIGDYYFWCPCERVDSNGVMSYNNRDIGLVEILQVVNKDLVLANLVHSGLVVTVKQAELRLIPDFSNADSSTNPPMVLTELIGPAVAAFDLHMIPSWFSTPIDAHLSGQLFTVFFVNETELVLEKFNRPGEFLNIDLLAVIERDLTVNHCNVRSKSFIQQVSESLLACRLFVGDLIVSHCSPASPDSTESIIDDLSPIANILSPVTSEDEPGAIWFASIDMVNEDGEVVQKMSPHHFNEAKFCIDRVRLDQSENVMRLLDYQQINVPIPCGLEGLYRFDPRLMTGVTKSRGQFESRYMVQGALTIPDLNNLFNKLIF